MKFPALQGAVAGGMQVVLSKAAANSTLVFGAGLYDETGQCVATHYGRSLEETLRQTEHYIGNRYSELRRARGLVRKAQSDAS